MKFQKKYLRNLQDVKIEKERNGQILAIRNKMIVNEDKEDVVVDVNKNKNGNLEIKYVSGKLKTIELSGDDEKVCKNKSTEETKKESKIVLEKMLKKEILKLKIKMNSRLICDEENACLVLNVGIVNENDEIISEEKNIINLDDLKKK